MKFTVHEPKTGKIIRTYEAPGPHETREGGGSSQVNLRERGRHTTTGASARPSGPSEAEVDAMLVESFQSMGFSPEAAEIAAAGRNCRPRSAARAATAIAATEDEDGRLDAMIESALADLCEGRR